MMKQMIAAGCMFLLGFGLYGEVQVHNGGVGGWNTVNALHSFEASVADYHPDTVILEFGMNDAVNPGRLQTLEQYEKNYRQLIQKLKQEKVKQIIIVNVNPIIESYLRERTPNHPEKGDLNQRIVSFNEILKKIADDEELVLIDLHELVMKNGGAAESEKSFLRNTKNNGGQDGVHLTAKAYQLLAEKIAKNVKPGQRVLCYGDSITYGANLSGAGTVTGENYPSYLWKIWNPDLVKAKKQPNPLSATSIQAGNLIRNGTFSIAGKDRIPMAWILWKKNKDSAVQITEKDSFGTQTFVRLTGASSSLVLFRSDFIQKKKSFYHLKCMVRGKGSLIIGVGRYGENKQPVMQDLQTKELTEKWEEVSLSFELPKKCKRMIIYFRTKETADITGCWLAPEQKK